MDLIFFFYKKEEELSSNNNNIHRKIPVKHMAVIYEWICDLLLSFFSWKMFCSNFKPALCSLWFLFCSTEEKRWWNLVSEELKIRVDLQTNCNNSFVNSKLLLYIILQTLLNGLYEYKLICLFFKNRKFTFLCIFG